MTSLVRSLVATAQSVVPTSFTSQPVIPSRSTKTTLVTQQSQPSLNNNNSSQPTVHTPTNHDINNNLSNNNNINPVNEPQSWWNIAHTINPLSPTPLSPSSNTNKKFSIKLFIMRARNIPRHSSSNQPQSCKISCHVTSYSFMKGTHILSDIPVITTELYKPAINPVYKQSYCITELPVDQLLKLNLVFNVICGDDEDIIGNVKLSSDILSRLISDNTSVHSKYYPIQSIDSSCHTLQSTDLHIILTSSMHAGLTDFSENCLDPSVMQNSTQQQCQQIDRDNERKNCISIDNNMSLSDKQKRLQQYQHVTSEIQSSESSYTQSLQILYTAFVEPLQQLVYKLNIDSSVHNSLIINIRALRDFHSHFNTSIHSSPNSVISTFTQFCDFFKLYIQYLNSYESCINALTNLRSNKQFQLFLSNTVIPSLHKHSGTQLDLLSYLIMPVQRIPRYVLLLRALLKQTDPTTNEWNLLYDVLIRIESIASQINETKRTIENMNKLYEIQCKIGADTNELILLVPHRRLIKSESHIEILEQHRSTNVFTTLKYKKRIVYLFNDIILYVSTELQYKSYVDLVTCKCDIIDGSNNTIIELISNKCHLLLRYDSIHECQLWYNEINEQIRLLQEQRAVQRKRKQDVRGNKNGTLMLEHDNTHSLIMNQLENLQVQKSITNTNNHSTANNNELPAPPSRPKSNKPNLGTFNAAQAEFLTSLIQQKPNEHTGTQPVNPHQSNTHTGSTYKVRQVVPRRGLVTDQTFSVDANSAG